MLFLSLFTYRLVVVFSSSGFFQDFPHLSLIFCCLSIINLGVVLGAFILLGGL